MDLWRRLTNNICGVASTQADTSSRCVVESASATHDFVVVNYSQTRDLPVYESVNSDYFTVGGHTWIISFHPRGAIMSYREPEYLGYAAASVYLCGADAATAVMVNARVTLGLVDRHGRMANVKTSDACDFSVTNSRSTFPGFVRESKLTSRRYLVDDCLTIRCVVTVIKPRTEATTVVSTEAAAAPIMADLHVHLERMLRDGKGADMTIDVGGRAFRAHRCVLAARSPVLDAELFGPMKRKDDTGRIEVPDMEPAVFEMLLHFMYTDSLPVVDGEEDCGVAVTQHLLVAADRYGVEKLKQACDVKLRGSLEVRTVATTLALAEQHQCPQLKDACLTFMSSSHKVLADVLATDGFRHLTASIP